jgi:hypothetical protein
MRKEIRTGKEERERERERNMEKFWALTEIILNKKCKYIGHK